MAHRNRIASKNLDVRETSHGQEIASTKAIQRELASAPHLSRLCARLGTHSNPLTHDGGECEC
jgi:hypothetical protein